MKKREYAQSLQNGLSGMEKTLFGEAAYKIFPWKIDQMMQLFIVMPVERSTAQKHGL